MKKMIKNYTNIEIISEVTGNGFYKSRKTINLLACLVIVSKKRDKFCRDFQLSITFYIVYKRKQFIIYSFIL